MVGPERTTVKDLPTVLPTGGRRRIIAALIEKTRAFVEEWLKSDGLPAEGAKRSRAQSRRNAEERAGRRLREQFFDHGAAELRELLVTAGVVVGEAIVVEAKQV